MKILLAEDALNYGLKNVYDAMILDIMMPKMDGLEVLRHLRENDVMAPVLMLTAKTQIEDKITGLDMGADDYLGKPFDMGELLARIRVMIRRNEKYTSSNLELGNIKLSINEQEISNVSSSLRLSKKEVEILEYFIRNQGKDIDVQALVENIWGDEEADINTINFYVSCVNNKIKTLNGNISIINTDNEVYKLEIN